MKADLFNGLNPEQHAASVFVDGPSIILAGAGSGKTRVLTNKVIYLIEKCGVPSSVIAMLTFTNKAAQEMRRRVNKELGFSGTFHSLCVRILRQDGGTIGINPEFSIYDHDDQEEIVKSIAKDISKGKKYSPNYILSRISSAKDQLMSPVRYRELFNDYSSETIADFYQAYQLTLERNNALDFDDLIYKTVRLFEQKNDVLKKYQEKFRHLLVDEFQDTNYAQYVLTKILAARYKNITVVGDFSQSIYSWRGAEIRNLTKFKEDFPETKTFYLEQNYRSTQNILDFAYKIISANQSHPILKLYTENQGGESVEIKKLANEQEEALFIAERVKQYADSKPRSVAVLYRINAQSRAIEEAFLHSGIPYTLIGGTRFYERREIKDILAFLRLIANPVDALSLARANKVGKKRFQQFKQHYEDLRNSHDTLTTDVIIDTVLKKIKYLELFNENDPEDFSRLENIKELRSVALVFPKLSDFLQQVALVESEYSESEKKKNSKTLVYMMTLHQAKGLEFPYVFIVGAEDGILPHSRSIYDFLSLEEERRLFYVGITRAQKKLYITHTDRRFMFGRHNSSRISRFLETDNSYDN